MDYFQTSKNGDLKCEDILVSELANHYQTPFYLYSHSTLERHCKVLIDNAKKYGGKVCYAVKANHNLNILKNIFEHGLGADVVSGGEIQKSIAAGASPSDMIFSGVGKTKKEILSLIHI